MRRYEAGSGLSYILVVIRKQPDWERVSGSVVLEQGISSVIQPGSEQKQICRFFHSSSFFISINSAPIPRSDKSHKFHNQGTNKAQTRSQIKYLTSCEVCNSFDLWTGTGRIDRLCRAISPRCVQRGRHLSPEGCSRCERKWHKWDGWEHKLWKHSWSSNASHPQRVLTLTTRGSRGHVKHRNAPVCDCLHQTRTGRTLGVSSPYRRHLLKYLCLRGHWKVSPETYAEEKQPRTQ